MIRPVVVFLTAVLLLGLAGCGNNETMSGQIHPSSEAEAAIDTEIVSPETETAVQTGLFPERILSGEAGDIHYSYYLPEGYDGRTKFPMMVVMPGYDRMWFGEDSSGANLDWNGFTSWMNLDTEMIVVSAQLTDWHETSARQAIELTEYFADSFAVDTSRIYAAGYSAGGETMSQAVSMRPDLYAAYLHAAYENAGWSEADIDAVLRLEIPDNAFFNEKGIYNYHGGANIVFDDPDNLDWVISHSKG